MGLSGGPLSGKYEKLERPTNHRISCVKPEERIAKTLSFSPAPIIRSSSKIPSCQASRAKRFIRSRAHNKANYVGVGLKILSESVTMQITLSGPFLQLTVTTTLRWKHCNTVRAFCTSDVSFRLPPMLNDSKLPAKKGSCKHSYKGRLHSKALTYAGCKHGKYPDVN